MSKRLNRPLAFYKSHVCYAEAADRVVSNLSFEELKEETRSPLHHLQQKSISHLFDLDGTDKRNAWSIPRVSIVYFEMRMEEIEPLDLSVIPARRK